MNITLTPPCPPHHWAFAPTVGDYGCMKCNERRYPSDPKYAEAAAEYAGYARAAILKAEGDGEARATPPAEPRKGEEA